MTTKSEYLQIRVTPRQKSELKRRAHREGRDVSSYVLTRALPPLQDRFAEILRNLSSDESPRFALAELNDFLTVLVPMELPEAAGAPELDDLSPFLRNYVAAMVEVAAGRLRIPPPSWTASVEALDRPWFATPLQGLRLHLLASAPIPFRRRNLFVDATVGDRI
jgi:uncharacterized protein (DUF1778 family)